VSRITAPLTFWAPGFAGIVSLYTVGLQSKRHISSLPGWGSMHTAPFCPQKQAFTLPYVIVSELGLCPSWTTGITMSLMMHLLFFKEWKSLSATHRLLLFALPLTLKRTHTHKCCHGLLSLWLCRLRLVDYIHRNLLKMKGAGKKRGFGGLDAGIGLSQLRARMCQVPYLAVSDCVK
jgi:hypothetical protein